MKRVFIGFDPREEVAFHVLARSIWERASEPISIIQMRLEQLPMVRDVHPLQSTQFSFSRFLVPYLSDYKGWSLFMDCDMLVRDDICHLFGHADPQYAVMVCKHDYTPRSERKFLGHQQTAYPKKNWSSVMLFNNDKCRALTPKAVNNESGLWLHQFKWLDSDREIGSLPLGWNHLVGEYGENHAALNYHYTLGGPWFEATEDCDHAEDWYRERGAMLQSTNGSNR